MICMISRLPLYLRLQPQPGPLCLQSPPITLTHICAPETPPLLKRADAAAIQRAREIVAKAIAESSRRNAARYENPGRNAYRLKPGTIVGGASVQRRQAATDPATTLSPSPPPLLEITDEIAQAAALVAEADLSNAAAFVPVVPAATNITRRQSLPTFWMEGLSRKGKVPSGNNSTYVVFRNVKSYGATGNGVTVSRPREAQAQPERQQTGKGRKRTPLTVCRACRTIRLPSTVP